MARHVTNLATKFEEPTPIRSGVMSDNVSRWLPLDTCYKETVRKYLQEAENWERLEVIRR